MAQKTNVIKGNPDLCVHFWILEQAVKSVSIGRCCKCLTEKEFKNSISADKNVWNNKKAADKDM